jgi:hypothetical protein
MLAAAAAFGLALWLPIPTVPDGARGQIAETIQRRMPGWEVDRIDPSWEGAYTVVATCDDRTLDFQLVPGHGLPAGGAWLRPSDENGIRLLGRVSDHNRYLIWFGERLTTRRLSCFAELAQPPEVEHRPRTAID